MPPLRLQVDGPNLVRPDGSLMVLAGVNFYLEWYSRYHDTAVYDVQHLREAIPAANVVRFVALLWHDSNGPDDGMECSADDPQHGYLRHRCLTLIRAAVQQITDAGLWVIITARAKYAAGYTWPDDPDVFHNSELRRRFYDMWRFIAREFSGTDYIAGYEVMSEPRTRSVSQKDVMSFMAGGCDAVHEADPRALCVVGPAPYYKMWTLPDVVLPGARQNIMFTFDFFVPKAFVMSNSASFLTNGDDPPSFPAQYSCKDVYDTWWRERCGSPDDMVLVDADFVMEVMQTFAGKLRQRLNAPVYCNQWGVKNEVWHSQGRLQYARALLAAFARENISSTYWIWRSYAKGGRDVGAAEWGFELVHNPGHDDNGQLLPELLEPAMTATLQAGFDRINPHPMPACDHDWSRRGNWSRQGHCRYTAGIYPPPPVQPPPPISPPDSCAVLLKLRDARLLDPPLWCYEIAVTVAGGCLQWFTSDGSDRFRRCESPTESSNDQCTHGPNVVCHSAELMSAPPPASPPPLAPPLLWPSTLPVFQPFSTPRMASPDSLLQLFLSGLTAHDGALVGALIGAATSAAVLVFCGMLYRHAFKSCRTRPKRRQETKKELRLPRKKLPKTAKHPSTRLLGSMMQCDPDSLSDAASLQRLEQKLGWGQAAGSSVSPAALWRKADVKMRVNPGPKKSSGTKKTWRCVHDRQPQYSPLRTSASSVSGLPV